MSFFQPTFTNGIQVVPNLQSDPFISGLQLQITSATTLTVSAGAARAYGSTDVIQANTPLSLNTTVLGAGGCYPFLPADITPSDDTSFGLYLIGDSTGVMATQYGGAPQLVIATGDNFLPPITIGANPFAIGFNCWRRIGTVYFSSTTNNLIAMQQTGSGVERDYMFQLAVPAVTTGAATTLTQVNLSAGDLPLNPYFASKVALQAAWTPATVTNILSLAPTGVTTATAPVRLKASVVSVQIIEDFEMVPSVQSLASSVYYQTTAGGDSLNLYLAGFRESLGVQAI